MFVRIWGNKDKVFRSWRIERDLGPELEKQLSNQIGSCGMYNPHFSPYTELLTSLSLFSGAQFRSIWAISHCCSFPLAPTLCPAVQPYVFRKGLFFKADAAGYLQNDLFASLSILKIVCYIAMSPIATGLHFLPTRALSHDKWLWDASRPRRGISWKTAFKELI